MSSIALGIRNAMYDRLANISDYNRTRKTHVRQLQASDLPALSVLIISEDMTSDGEHNTGVPKFIINPIIGVSIVRGFKRPEDLDADIDADATLILDKLLCDPSFVGFPGPDSDDPNPAVGLFEGITRIASRRQEHQQGETYLTELRLDMTFVSRIYFEPNVPDHYKGMTITTHPFNDQNAPAIVKHVDVPDWT